jgi:hypothetical protein
MKGVLKIFLKKIKKIFAVLKNTCIFAPMFITKDKKQDKNIYLNL